jgi:enoyl-CoA hydratase/carnithine racemase
VADVRLNRPEKLNAVDSAMFSALVETGEALKSDRSVRAVVLSGEGRAFCAGLDLASFGQMASPEGRVSLGSSLIDRPEGRIANQGQQAVWVWQELEVPVIAAVTGVALGAGFQIALGADIRFVSSDAQLSVLEIRWGLIPDMTGTYLLPRLVGLDVAKELTWTGRTVGAEEAVRLGIATRLSDRPLDDARELAVRLAAANPHAIRAAKTLLNRAYEDSPAVHFKVTEDAMVGLMGSPNQTEAVRAYFDKREPKFEDA